MKIELTDSPSESDKEALKKGLSAHSAKHNHTWDEKEVGLFCRDENGIVVAGLVGETFFGWLYIEHLWVSDALRGQGIGKKLVRFAEDEAKRRGCSHSALDTFTFQSPKFYEHLGYERSGQFTDFPKGERLIYYSKKL